MRSSGSGSAGPAGDENGAPGAPRPVKPRGQVPARAPLAPSPSKGKRQRFDEPEPEPDFEPPSSSPLVFTECTPASTSARRTLPPSSAKGPTRPYSPAPPGAGGADLFVQEPAPARVPSGSFDFWSDSAALAPVSAGPRAGDETEYDSDEEDDEEDIWGDWEYGREVDDESDDEDTIAASTSAKGKGKVVVDAAGKPVRGAISRAREERRQLQAQRPWREDLSGSSHLERAFRKRYPVIAQAVISLVDTEIHVLRDDCRHLKRQRTLARSNEYIILNTAPTDLRNHFLSILEPEVPQLLLDVANGTVDWTRLKIKPVGLHDHSPGEYLKIGEMGFVAGGPGVVDMDAELDRCRSRKRKRDEDGDGEGHDSYDGRILRARAGSPLYHRRKRIKYVGTSNAIDGPPGRKKQHAYVNKAHYTKEDILFLGCPGVEIPDQLDLAAEQRVAESYSAELYRLTTMPRGTRSPAFSVASESLCINLFQCGRGADYLEAAKRRAAAAGVPWSPPRVGDGPIPANDASPCVVYFRTQARRRSLKCVAAVFGAGHTKLIKPMSGKYATFTLPPVAATNTHASATRQTIYVRTEELEKLGIVVGVGVSRFGVDPATLSPRLWVAKGKGCDWTEVDATLFLNDSGIERMHQWSRELALSVADGAFPGTEVKIAAELIEKLRSEGNTLPAKGSWYAFRGNMRKQSLAAKDLIVQLRRSTPVQLTAAKWGSAPGLALTPALPALTALMISNPTGTAAIGRSASALHPSGYVVQFDADGSLWDLGSAVVGTDEKHKKTRTNSFNKLVRAVASWEVELKKQKVVG